jgi:hypothetical protein
VFPFLQVLYVFLFSPLRATCPTYSIRIILVIEISFGNVGVKSISQLRVFFFCDYFRIFETGRTVLSYDRYPSQFLPAAILVHKFLSSSDLQMTAQRTVSCVIYKQAAVRPT